MAVGYIFMPVLLLLY